ncbi:Gypsy retrotransposon integrase-like protein 1 [Zalaria obscura]|uniref:Gypsy retrotransposon integrase-like protein 1 n=1 Tax=Zalaria obscura TaxID=2024903 RepID=A0ACC3S7Z3_9PEZI
MKMDHLKSILGGFLPQSDVERLIAGDRRPVDGTIMERLQAVSRILESNDKESSKQMTDLEPAARKGCSPTQLGQLLETMLETSGQHSVDDDGNVDYQGKASGLLVLRRICEQCTQLLEVGRTNEEEIPMPTYVRTSSAVQSQCVPSQEEPSLKLLPTQATAISLINIAFERAFTLINFIHRLSFESACTKIYTRGPFQSSESTRRDRRQYVLLYEVLAVGTICRGDDAAHDLENA